jgi:hypothetical protein
VEVLYSVEILRELESACPPATGARYLFTDDGDGWAGVFVEGPLRGMVTFLDDEDPHPVPFFRDLDRFLRALIDAGRRHIGWRAMDMDYPLSRDSDESLAGEAAPLPRLSLDRYRAASTVEEARESAEVAVYLTPPGERDTLRELLDSELPSVRRLAQWRMR